MAQLVSYARKYEEFEKRGMRIAGISVDPPTHNEAMPLEKLIPYYRGAFFTTVALKRRFSELKDRTAFKEVDRYQQMVKEYAGAIKETAEQNS